MILKYTTGKLPPNFFMLGVTIVFLGVIAFFNQEPAGAIAFFLAIPFLFTQTGILIDTETRRIKKYTGLFTLQSGKWENIGQIHHLRIIRVQQTTGMAVLTIARNETNVVYKLIAVLPNENIELLAGENQFINEAAGDISRGLNVEVKNSAKTNK